MSTNNFSVLFNKFSKAEFSRNVNDGLKSRIKSCGVEYWRREGGPLLAIRTDGINAILWDNGNECKILNPASTEAEIVELLNSL